jgi:protein-S-isoprenylcysteine O-methyltransferase Ste14
LIVGLSLMIWSLSYLGTNISVVPQARAVVTTGPYSYVRHPLYAAELVNVVGICLSLEGALPWLLLGAWVLLQVIRARNEEALLRKTLSGYAAYQRTTPMLIPWRKLARAQPPRPSAEGAPCTVPDGPDDV